MKFNCKQSELSKGLATVGHAVSTRSTLPVLANLLLTIEGDHLRLSATNLEIAITCLVPAQVQEGGSTTVPAKLLTDFVNALGPGEVELSPLPGGIHGLRVRGGRSEANIRGMDPSEFPVIQRLDGEGGAAILDCGELRSMISQTAFAAATDDARPIFTGVFMRVRDSRLTFAAADTFRLAVRYTEVPGVDNRFGELLIPARSLNELAKVLPTEGNVEMFISPARNQAMFRAAGVEMTANLIEGQFVNYEAIMPKSHQTRVVIPTAAMRDAVKRTSLFARTESAGNIVRITVTPGNEGLTPGVVTLQATNDEFGDATSTVDAVVDGPGLDILFNIKYVSDMLAVIDAPELVLELNTAQQPGVLKPQGTQAYSYIVMPLHSR